MKFALFAAAALVAAPALAQTSGSTGTNSPSNVGASGAPDSTSNPAGQDAMSTNPQSTTPPADTSTATPANDPAMTTQGTTGQDAMAGSAAGGNMSAGGYQPSQPMPMASGGQQPVFQPGQSVAQAYPAPAPLAKYPVCKKGQYDKCIQRGGR